MKVVKGFNYIVAIASLELEKQHVNPFRKHWREPNTERVAVRAARIPGVKTEP